MDSHTAAPLGELGQAWVQGGGFWSLVWIDKVWSRRGWRKGAPGEGWEAPQQGCHFLEDLGLQPRPSMRRRARGAHRGQPGPRETLSEEPQRGRGRCVVLDRRAQRSPPQGWGLIGAPRESQTSEGAQTPLPGRAGPAGTGAGAQGWFRAPGACPAPSHRCYASSLPTEPSQRAVSPLAAPLRSEQPPGGRVPEPR